MTLVSGCCSAPVRVAVEYDTTWGARPVVTNWHVCAACGHAADSAPKTTGVQIPLCDKAGATRGVALVDEADLDVVGVYRWHLHPDGYAVRKTPRGSGNRASVRMHRELLGLVGRDRRTQVDHINGDKLDNRRSNLRVVTNAENQQNRRHGSGASQHRGVSWHADSSRWRAYGSLNRKHQHLGYYDDEQDAAKAAADWRAANHPFSPEAASLQEGTDDAQ
jgi:hypothetical protein